MKPAKFFLIFISIFFLSCEKKSTATPQTSEVFKPKAGSPIALGAHPRLFLTAEELPVYRNKIKRFYWQDFKKFVTVMDGLMTAVPEKKPFKGWNDLFGAMRSYAFLYQIDPATIPGVAAGHSKREYGRRAIELALYVAANLEDTWNEKHQAAENLTTDKGGLASLALQVVYDWTHDLATPDERRKIVDRLITMWDNRYDSRKVKLENHYATASHVYAGALCFYGDQELGASYMTKAQMMMNSFEDIFVQRQLGVAEIIFEGSSDWIEGDSYAFDCYTSLMMLAAASGSALDRDFFDESSWLKYGAYYLYFNLMPMPFDGDYFYSQQNTSSLIRANDRVTSQVMNIAAAMYAKTEPDISAFAAWFCERSPYGETVDEYRRYKPHLFDFFYKFMFGTKHVPKKPPQEIRLPLSMKLGQMHAMRSDHVSNDASLVQFYCPTYWYKNGHNEPEQGAFTIHRFGTLAVSASNSKNAGKEIPKVKSKGKGFIQNNVLGIGDDALLELEMDTPGKKADSPEWFKPGAETQIGQLDALEIKTGAFDYVNYDYTCSYRDGSKTDLARRALVYLRGPVNQEYVVVMDRLDSSERKTFIMHTPVEPQALDGEWQSVRPGFFQSQTRRVKIVNRLGDAHGQMYLTSVFPQSATFHKIGGTGFEWTTADGEPLEYDVTRFNDKTRFLLGDHTLQIRSQENRFLTVMQIGDANTMGPPASVEKLSGANWIGAFINQNRVVIFSNSEKPLTQLTYRLSSEKRVRHLITELKPNTNFTASKNGRVVFSGTSGKNGVIWFEDATTGGGEYLVSQK